MRGIGLAFVLAAVLLAYMPATGFGEPNEPEPLVEWKRATSARVTAISEELKILEGELSAAHPLYAVWLNRLAAEFHSLGNIAAQDSQLHTEAAQLHIYAVQFYGRALDIFKESLGATHYLYATTLHEIANVLHSSEDDAQAAELHRQAANILSENLLAEMLGETPAHYDETPQHLLSEAARHWANFLRGFAESDIAHGGRPSEMEWAYLQNLEFSYQILELVSEGLSEREQMAMAERFRDHLDGYLSLALRTDDMAREAFQWILQWKGAIFSRQQRYRRIIPSPVRDLLFDRLLQISQQLERFYRRKHASLPKEQLALLVAEIELARRENRQAVDSRQQLRTLFEWYARLLPKKKLAATLLEDVRAIALSAERDQLEAELSRQSAASGPPWQMVTVEDVAGALPSDSVLVDFLEFGKWSAPQEGELSYQPSIMASILHPNGTVRLIDLGDKQPLLERFAAWRDCLIRDSEMKADQYLCLPDGEELRATLWEPILAALGAPDTVLISPDGILGYLPWAALPGADSTTYLIDEYEIVIQPFPQQMPTLGETAERRQSRESLLLVGNVDYGAAPVERSKPDKQSTALQDTALSRGKEGTYWPALDTLDEIDAVEELFQERAGKGEVQVAAPTRRTGIQKPNCPYFGRDRIARLTQHDASKWCFRQRAPKSTYLHVATHGFFFPMGIQVFPTELGYHPERLSGLVLAGANRRGQRPQDDDGILTAMEVSFMPF